MLVTNLTKYMGTATIAVILSALSTQAQSLPAPEYIGPSIEPAYPDDFQLLDLSSQVADIVPADLAPQISEWTRLNQPGDTMALSGENLSLLSGAAEGTDSHFLFLGQSGGTTVLGEGEVLNQADHRAAVTLPNTLPADQMYLMWPKNGVGYGSPVVINRADLWWSAQELNKGSRTFAIYGRGLVADKSDENSKAYVYVEELGQWLTATDSNPFRAEFIMPSGTPAGTYTLRAHNGTGGRYGWSSSAQVTLEAVTAWNDDSSTWINVKDYGAKGDGSSDDHTAIINALSACPSGGTVYFPAGTYRVSKTIWNIGSNKRVLGAGMDQTTITRHASFTSSINSYLIMNGLSSVEIKDMTLSTGPYWSSKLTNNRYSENLRFVNVRFTERDWTGGKYEFIDVHDSDGVLFEGCEFITTTGIFLGTAQNVHFRSSNFYGIRDCNGMVYQKGGDRVSVIDCIAQPLDSSDNTNGDNWSKGRWIVGSGGWGAMRCFYFGDNETIDMMPREPIGTYVDQNSGEQFLFEGLATLFRGQPSTATETTITLPTIGTSHVGNIISIVGGRGIGQNREVVAYDSSTKTLTLDEPWRVVPDSESTVAIGHFMSRMAVYNNKFDGMERATSTVAEDITASAGVSAYGGCSDLVVSDNYFHQLATAIFNWGNGEPTAAGNANIVMQPNHFNLFVDNRIENCKRGAVNQAYIDKHYLTVEQDITLFGNVFRNNLIGDITETAIKSVVNNDQLLMDMAVFDQNMVTNSSNEKAEAANALYQVWIEPSSITIPTPPGGTPAPVLSRIEITGPVFVDEGTEAQFYCTGYYSDGSSSSVDAAWTENSAYASINAAGQLQTSDVDADQTVTITAALDGKTDTFEATISYVPPVLESIAINGTSVMDEGTSTPFSCTAYYTDGSSAAVTPTWSEDSSYASISSGGLLTAADVTADQVVTITALFEGVSATHTVTVSYVPPLLTGLVIIGPVAVNELETAQYNCIGRFSDGTSTLVSPSWSDNSAAASIDSTGLLTANDVEASTPMTITASLGGLTVTYSLLVTYVEPYIVGIEISGPASVQEESNAQFSCNAVFSDGSRFAISPAWSVSGSGTISGSGLLTAGDVTADSTATLSASYDGYTDDLTVTIAYVAPTVTGLSIVGPVYVDEGETASYSCTAQYSDGTSGSVTPVWSMTSSYAAISASGLLSTGDVTEDENAVLYASLDGVTVSLTIQISFVPPPVVITGISIGSAPESMEENSEVTLGCTAVYSDGTSETLTDGIAWSVSGKATITDGLLQSGNVDDAAVLTVTASYSGFEDSVDITVTPVGTQVIYPLAGFTGQTVKARLWDDAAGTWYELGEMVAPDELVIKNVTEGQWYWISIEVFDSSLGDWTSVHGNWISM